MAIAVHLQWPEVNADQYDRLKDHVGWERDVPQGGILHITSFSPQGAHIVDVWESQEAFQRFLEDRLMPGVQEIGIQGEPEPQVYPVHDLFTPGIDRGLPGIP